jgi:HK97 family phage major capsid protein
MTAEEIAAKAAADKAAADAARPWFKFLEEFGTYKAGTVVQLDDNVSSVLLAAKKCEKTTRPAEVDTKAADIVRGLDAAIEKKLDSALNAAFKNLGDRLTLTVDKGSGRPEIRVGEAREYQDPKLGFKNINDQCRAVMKYVKSGQKDVHPGLELQLKAPTTYGQEGLGADGGFLLAPQFLQELIRYTFADEGIMGRCRSFTTTGNSLTIPKDETTPWQSSGVQVFWVAEAAQATQSKPQVGQTNLLLHKLTALVPVTEEMMQDSFTGIGEYITSLAGDRIRWKVEDAIVNGIGNGMPLGFSKGGALYVQNGTSGQTTLTINITNLAAMLGDIMPESQQNLVWLVHPSAYNQLVVMSNANTSLYIPYGGLETTKGYMGRLMGIPLIMSTHCQTLGTQGCLYLVDMSKYFFLSKGTGIEAAMSIHLYFDYSVNTFRFNFRCDGRTWMSAPYLLPDNTTKLSAFVALAGI